MINVNIPMTKRIAIVAISSFIALYITQRKILKNIVKQTIMIYLFGVIFDLAGVAVVFMGLDCDCFIDFAFAGFLILVGMIIECKST